MTMFVLFKYNQVRKPVVNSNSIKDKIISQSRSKLHPECAAVVKAAIKAGIKPKVVV